MQTSNRKHVIVPRLEALVDSGDWRLAWEMIAQGGPAEVYQVFVDGARVATTTAPETVLTGLRPGSATRIDVLAVSRLDRDGNYEGGYLPERQSGARLALTVPPVDLGDDPDFAAYRIYWSSDGSEPTALMAENWGAANNVFRTVPLDDGVTYRFRATLMDQAGNESDYGATLAATINLPPAAVEDAAVAYDAGTRKATVTATEPAGSAAAGYLLLANHLPGWGLVQGLVEQPVRIWLPGDTISWTSPMLVAGTWRWEIRAVGATGLQSGATGLALTLALDGSDLVAQDAQPAAPVYVDAVPIAGGKLRVSVVLGNETDVTAVAVALDGTQVVSTLATGALEYTLETDALADGTTVAVTAVALNGAVESTPAGPVSATADAAAPGGDRTLTAVRI